MDKLDTGNSGWLGPKELARWVIFHPDVEMTLRLGRSPGGDRVQLPVPDDQKSKPPFTPGKTGENSLGVALDAIQMTVLRTETQQPQNQGAKAQYMQQFKMLDMKQRNGYLKLDQLKKLDKDPNAVTILALFAWADRDSNEKLTEKELSDFLDMAMSLHASQTRLTFADNGQSLFEMLDANRDGQLSIRELRTAWKRMEPFDRDKKGAVDRKEIPRQYQLMVSQGGPFVNQNAQAGANFGVTVVQSLPSRGPLWFRKMDVNNDGDVSEREFLGSKEDFKRINTSGDGLISVEEAEKADAWFREKMKKPE
jgi:Ca2+-binding EF-hand superfamily protein